MSKFLETKEQTDNKHVSHSGLDISLELQILYHHAFYIAQE